MRTVQRWEVELQLPIRRIDTGRGQVTYAFVDELDRWRESAGARKAEAEALNGAENNGSSPGTNAQPVPVPAPVQPSLGGEPARLIAVVAAVVVTVAALSVLAWYWHASPHSLSGPAAARVSGNALHVFDAAGRPLWEYPFEFSLTDAAYTHVPPGRQGATILIADVDGDSIAEVLFVSEPWLPHGQGLFCFNADGSLRFNHVPDRTVTFGRKDYAPTWRGVSVYVSGPPGHPRDIWFVSTHLEEFPTLLEKLDGAGRRTAEYWSNGQITSLMTSEDGGKPIVFVGAISNEFKGGSLAALDAGNPSGSAPAASDDYRCTGCPPGQPLAFLVFPRLDVTAAIGTHASVSNVFRDQLDQVLVDVHHDVGDGVPQELRSSAMTHYRLDRQYHVVGADLGERLPQVHALFERKGLLDHPFSDARDDRYLWPVRRWDGARFVEITRPKTLR